jgi:hypothetical protein
LADRQTVIDGLPVFGENHRARQGYYAACGGHETETRFCLVTQDENANER